MKNNNYDMKNLNTYIQENTCINEKLVVVHKSYSCTPKTKIELKEIIKDRLAYDPNADLNDIDVSNITDMSDLFWGLNPHNIDISQWDVSNVENMNSMFWSCKNFNSDLSAWDVSHVKNMGCIFFYCEKFNSDISGWDVSKVKYMNNMFNGCDSMKELPEWYKNK